MYSDIAVNPESDIFRMACKTHIFGQSYLAKSDENFGKRKISVDELVADNVVPAPSVKGSSKMHTAYCILHTDILIKLSQELQVP